MFCTFDLSGASSQDYTNAYEALSHIGFKTTLLSDQGNEVKLPNTSVVGEFNGNSKEQVRNSVREKVCIAFERLGLKSHILVIVSTSYCWGTEFT